jgi:hypothetical protein
VLEGLRFLRSRQVLLMTFVVDLVAMVFAMPRALFPALAEQVYGGGEQTAGAALLRARRRARSAARCSPAGSGASPATASAVSPRSWCGGWRSPCSG